jgi:glycosyltransferase involved in cell wall biosynthesis
MKMLVLSFYFHPDLSAGSFRTTALVDALRERAPAGTEIDVITTQPNRYQSFSHAADEIETQGGVRIRRIRIPAHRSDMLGQSRSFATFARRALAHVRGNSYDLVFATSSRLMTAALGAWIARRQRARLYLDIRDIFVDTIADILPAPAAAPVRAVFSAVEWWTMRRADRINLVSRGFEEYFRRRYPTRRLSWFTNGIDDEFLRGAAPAPSDAPREPGAVTILYAGNIGESQALHLVLPGLARSLDGIARFRIVGDGGRRMALEAALTAAAVRNVELQPPMKRAQLLDAYRGADVLFLHLGTHAAFEKVLPSKIFEYAALGKPVLAGVGGYAARFVREEVDNAAVFAPCDVEGAVRAFRALDIRDRPRPGFVAKFARASIARAMADEILGLGRESLSAAEEPARDSS